MEPTGAHAEHAGRQARRQRLDGLIQRSGMKVPAAMKAAARDAFAPGSLGKKQKELTALAIAVATNCWE